PVRTERAGAALGGPAVGRRRRTGAGRAGGLGARVRPAAGWRTAVIARFWTARATPDRAPRYADHLRTRGLPQLRALDGYAGASLLRRDTDGEAELIVITRWRSLDAVRAFAGADVEAAVVEDEAAAVLIRYDERVRHYELVVEDAGAGN